MNMALSASKISAVLDAMASGTTRSMMKIAEEAGVSVSSVFKIEKDYPLWNWFRLQGEDLRGKHNKSS